MSAIIMLKTEYIIAKIYFLSMLPFPVISSFIVGLIVILRCATIVLYPTDFITMKLFFSISIFCENIEFICFVHWWAHTLEDYAKLAGALPKQQQQKYDDFQSDAVRILHQYACNRVANVHWNVTWKYELQISWNFDAGNSWAPERIVEMPIRLDWHRSALRVSAPRGHHHRRCECMLRPSVELWFDFLTSRKLARFSVKD